jgi:NO-binding membrane sensor protein with MHYT domain
MQDDFATVDASAGPQAEPSAMLAMLALLVAALALKVVLTSASAGRGARSPQDAAVALWPGVLAWGLGLWASGLLALVGLEPVSDLRFSLADAGWLLAAALLSGLPPLLWLTRRAPEERSVVRLGGAALWLTLPAMAMPVGWLHAARLDPAPLWLHGWAVLGTLVATVGVGAALSLAHNPMGVSRRARRLWRTAAALAGGAALLLGQVLVHEGALVSDEAFSSATASLPVGMMAGVGALTPLLLVGLMVLQRLRRYAAEDRRERRRQGRGGGRTALPADAVSSLGPATEGSVWPHSGPPSRTPVAAQPRSRSKHRRHRVL